MHVMMRIDMADGNSVVSQVGDLVREFGLNSTNQFLCQGHAPHCVEQKCTISVENGLERAGVAERPEIRDIEVHAEGTVRMHSRSVDCLINTRAVPHDRRGSDRTFRHQLKDALVNGCCRAEVVRIHDYP